MAQCQRAYEAVAKNTGLDDRSFEFLERILTLDGLTQQMFTRLDTKRGGSDIGPTFHRLEISCATTNPDIYQNLDTFLSQKLPEYPADILETEERLIYVTRGGQEISGTRKKVTFRLHSRKLDSVVRKFQEGGHDVSYDEGMDATYASRTFATLLVYDGTNLDFVEAQGDPAVKKKGE